MLATARPKQDLFSVQGCSQQKGIQFQFLLKLLTTGTRGFYLVPSNGMVPEEVHDDYVYMCVCVFIQIRQNSDIHSVLYIGL